MTTLRENPSILLAEAESWVETVWHAASARWSGRSGQDKSYRSHVILPAVADIVRELYGDRRLRTLDMGCGDGILLEDSRTVDFTLSLGVYLGVDINPELIERARLRHQGEHIRFLHGDLTDSGLARRIARFSAVWDIILSIFVVQEIPDIAAFLRTLEHVLGQDSRAVLVTVHPEFAEWLNAQGHVKIEGRLGGAGGNDSPPWRWAGLYPIVDEPGEPFHLPHFHRTVEDYRALCRRWGLIVEEIRELPDRHHSLPQLVAEGRSPFAPFPTNVYWPRIGESPSAVALIIRKETHGG